MNRRSLVALAFSAMLVVVPPAWAQGPGSGNGNANEQGNGSGQGNGQGDSSNDGNGQRSGNSGNGQGNANAAGQGNSNGTGNGNAGGATTAAPAGAGSVAPSVSGEAPARGHEQSESDVLAAVEAGRAVPLSSLMPDVRTRTGGEIINAELVQAGGALLYAVRVLAPDGRVSTEYYDARSGQHVER